MDKVVYLSKTVKEYSFKDKQLFIQTLNTIESLSKFANTMYLAQLLQPEEKNSFCEEDE